MPQEELKRGAHFAKESAPQTPSSEASSSRDDTDDMGSSDYSTGWSFRRAYDHPDYRVSRHRFYPHVGNGGRYRHVATSSSYQVANNPPNMLYELVMGGMLRGVFARVHGREA